MYISLFFSFYSKDILLLLLSANRP